MQCENTAVSLFFILYLYLKTVLVNSVIHNVQREKDRTIERDSVVMF